MIIELNKLDFWQIWNCILIHRWKIHQKLLINKITASSSKIWCKSLQNGSLYGGSIAVEFPWVYIPQQAPATIHYMMPAPELSGWLIWHHTGTHKFFVLLCWSLSFCSCCGTVFQTCFMLSLQVQAFIPFREAQVTFPCSDTSLTAVEQSVFTWEAWASFPIICSGGKRAY